MHTATYLELFFFLAFFLLFKPASTELLLLNLMKPREAIAINTETGVIGQIKFMIPTLMESNSLIFGSNYQLWPDRASIGRTNCPHRTLLITNNELRGYQLIFKCSEDYFMHKGKVIKRHEDYILEHIPQKNHNMIRPPVKIIYPRLLLPFVEGCHLTA
ncbi:hypothetical protein BDF20DRAFT_835176 [Mycotypha africana]|uniref:uncharacterized protein n=1 Tax=Mycotypha africana TaxID=64632 RepID=UPI002301653A|nr:uncharacterized protein BDF20DRAFT_835176 [Mycotypha africana]KAI8979119.1 hypothetical protein BDF20DRAFT_835176 [Mycotypha africana]